MTEVAPESEVVRSVLLAGLDDWVDPGLIYHMAAYLGAEPADRRLVVLAVMVEVMTSGWMRPGDVSDGVFRAWPGSAGENTVRVVQGFREVGSLIRPGDVAWFENTEFGDAIARSLSDS